MNKKMSRYKGLILSCVSMMMIVVCVCSFSFESKAQTPLYYEIPVAEPTVSANSGYITVLWQNKSTGQVLPYLYYWSVTPTNSDSSTSTMSITVQKNGYLYFYVNQANSGKCVASIYEINDGGGCSLKASDVYTAGYNIFNCNYSSSYKILGYYVRGNYGDMNDDFSYGENRNFVISWSDDDKQLEYMVNLYNKLVENNADNDTIISKLNSIMTTNSSIDSKISQLLDLQEETNTWLEKIWNSIQQFFNPDEEDKEESDKLQSESNDKTDKLDDLNEQNKTDKVDVDSATNSVEENVDLDSIDNYGNVLSVITENQYILQILLLVFSVALVAYVLFGKK